MLGGTTSTISFCPLDNYTTCLTETDKKFNLFSLIRILLVAFMECFSRGRKTWCATTFSESLLKNKKQTKKNFANSLIPRSKTRLKHPHLSL